MRLTPAQMLDDAYLARRARLIDPKRAQDFGPGHAPQGGTIYLTAADESGMMVSFIQSNYMGFGSGIVVPGYGLSLQNRGHGFTLDARQRQPRRPGQAAVPHHHPGLPHQGRPAGHELRRDGRRHAAAGPPADAGAHARLPPAAAGRLRRAALALVRRHRSTPSRVSTPPPRRACATWGIASSPSPTATRTTAPGSSSGAWATRRRGRTGYAAASDPRRDGQAVGF